MKSKKVKLKLNRDTVRVLTELNTQKVKGGFQVNPDKTINPDTVCINSGTCICTPGRPVMIDHAPLLAPIVYDDASWCAELDVK